MEWVETTAKSVAEAQDLALDQLGVAADEAEFEILEEPKSGLFGRMRGEARVRARVQPTAVRPKQERRSRSKQQNKRSGAKKSGDDRSSESDSSDTGSDTTATASAPESDAGSRPKQASAGRTSSRNERPARSKQPKQNKEQSMSDDRPESNVTPQEVGDAAVAFMADLASAFGIDDATTELTVDDTDLEVRVSGTECGLMVGPGGRTLTAVQDLARVASQRRLGDHDTRLRIDVGGYREKRRGALEKFAATVAAQVLETGSAKALEPMQSADRKAVHDAVIEIDGVTSHSEGDDPMRRVVITPG